jgi:hypothetical protein
VAAYFERQRLQLFSERDKIEAAASELAERQQEFRRDRTDLEQYFASREEELALRSNASAVDQLQTQILQLKSQIDRSREIWQSERHEAERTIRNLIEQLTSREAAAVQATPADLQSAAPRDAA